MDSQDNETLAPLQPSKLSPAVKRFRNGIRKHPKKLTLDSVDDDTDYNRSNRRWATQQTKGVHQNQKSRKRNNKTGRRVKA